jgi:hypothetical protein
LHLVRGKVVSFRCKKCKGTIPVDGRALSSATPMPLPAPSIPPPEGDPRGHFPSEPSARLSLSDGIVVHEGIPSTTGLNVDTPAAFTHPSPPMQRPFVPGASRTPAYGSAPSSYPSALPPPLSRTEPPEPLHRSDPPPSFRSTARGKKIAGAALVAAVGLTLWGVGVRQSSQPATASIPAMNDRAAAQPAQTSELRAAPEPVQPAVTTDSVKVAPSKEEAPPPKLSPAAARARARAARAAAAAEAPSEPAAAPEEAPTPAPLTGSAAAALEATNAAAQEIDFNKESARQALEDAGQKAASCRTIDMPAGAARIAVTFAPAGNVTAAVVESGPLVGTAAGGCVASKFRTVRVPAFTGEPVTVHKTITF